MPSRSNLRFNFLTFGEKWSSSVIVPWSSPETPPVSWEPLRQSPHLQDQSDPSSHGSVGEPTQSTEPRGLIQRDRASPAPPTQKHYQCTAVMPLMASQIQHSPPLKLRPYGGIQMCVLLLLLFLLSDAVATSASYSSTMSSTCEPGKVLIFIWRVICC